MHVPLHQRASLFQGSRASRGQRSSRALGLAPRVDPHPVVVRAASNAGSGADDGLSRARKPVLGPQNLAQLSEVLNDINDTNQLQTALVSALTAEDYPLAGRIRDQLAKVTGATPQRIDWGTLGLPAWLTDRVERLGFKFPTEVQRRAATVVSSGLDAIIMSETGSGKTLAFLVPMLSRLTYPPDVYLDDMKGPQAVVIVPTLELGVQCALTVFKLFGGNVSRGQPGDSANIFTYQGPRGVKVRGLLNKEEIAMAKGTDYLKGVHVVVATAPALMDVYSGQDRMPVLDFLKVLVVDEYDECFRTAPEAMAMIMSSAAMNNTSGSKPQTVLVGATITPSHIELALSAGWVREAVQITVGRERSMPSALKHRYVVVQQEHQKLAVLTRLLRQDLELLGDDPLTPARAMVFTNSAEEAASATAPLRDALWGDHQLAVLLPPGTRLPPSPGEVPAEQELQQDGPQAQASTSHELAQSSPFSAVDPIRALHSFRDNKTSLLVCPPQAARGLDLPAVSHVYNLGVPEDENAYLHRAGRSGRIGSTAGGIITTLVTGEELPRLQELGRRLGVEIQVEQAPEGVLAQQVAGGGQEPPDLEKLRRGLEDLYSLM